MNNAQRKTISHIIDSITGIGERIESAVERLSLPGANLVEIKAEFGDFGTMLRVAQSEIEDERDAEQEKYDNLPESLQGGDKGEGILAGVEALDSAVDYLGQAALALRTETTDVEELTEEVHAAVNDDLEAAIGALEEATA